MSTVNMHEAKTHLSRLVEKIESGEEAEIIIARNGKPAAKLVAMKADKIPALRLGTLEGKFKSVSQEEFDASNDEVANLFYGEDKS